MAMHESTKRGIGDCVIPPAFSFTADEGGLYRIFYGGIAAYQEGSEIMLNYSPSSSHLSFDVDSVFAPYYSANSDFAVKVYSMHMKANDKLYLQSALINTKMFWEVQKIG